MSDPITQLRADITTALEHLQPMASTRVLTFETTEIDDDGDVTGSWGSITSGGNQIVNVGLLKLALTVHTQSLTEEEEDD